uniref:Microtubule associated protein 6 n=1 Tax=Caenorhabditis tropicalis TaxID=1561998 RepID=A0A1I7USG6_9PELO
MADISVVIDTNPDRNGARWTLHASYFSPFRVHPSGERDDIGYLMSSQMAEKFMAQGSPVYISDTFWHADKLKYSPRFPQPHFFPECPDVPRSYSERLLRLWSLHPQERPGSPMTGIERFFPATMTEAVHDPFVQEVYVATPFGYNPELPDRTPYYTRRVVPPPGYYTPSPWIPRADGSEGWAPQPFGPPNPRYDPNAYSLKSSQVFPHYSEPGFWTIFRQQSQNRRNLEAQMAQGDGRQIRHVEPEGTQPQGATNSPGSSQMPSGTLQYQETGGQQIKEDDKQGQLVIPKSRPHDSEAPATEAPPRATEVSEAPKPPTEAPATEAPPQAPEVSEAPKQSTEAPATEAPPQAPQVSEAPKQAPVAPKQAPEASQQFTEAYQKAKKAEEQAAKAFQQLSAKAPHDVQKTQILARHTEGVVKQQGSSASRQSIHTAVESASDPYYGRFERVGSHVRETPIFVEGEFRPRNDSSPQASSSERADSWDSRLMPSELELDTVWESASQRGESQEDSQMAHPEMTYSAADQRAASDVGKDRQPIQPNLSSSPDPYKQQHSETLMLESLPLEWVAEAQVDKYGNTRMVRSTERMHSMLFDLPTQEEAGAQSASSLHTAISCSNEVIQEAIASASHADIDMRAPNSSFRKLSKSQKKKLKAKAKKEEAKAELEELERIHARQLEEEAAMENEIVLMEEAMTSYVNVYSVARSLYFGYRAGGSQDLTGVQLQIAEFYATKCVFLSHFLAQEDHLMKWVSWQYVNYQQQNHWRFARLFEHLLSRLSESSQTIQEDVVWLHSHQGKRSWPDAIEAYYTFILHHPRMVFSGSPYQDVQFNTVPNAASMNITPICKYLGRSFIFRMGQTSVESNLQHFRSDLEIQFLREYFEVELCQHLWTRQATRRYFTDWADFFSAIGHSQLTDHLQFLLALDSEIIEYDASRLCFLEDRTNERNVFLAVLLHYVNNVFGTKYEVSELDLDEDVEDKDEDPNDD